MFASQARIGVHSSSVSLMDWHSQTEFRKEVLIIKLLNVMVHEMHPTWLLTAKTLKQAAQEGTPFCEQCMQCNN